MTELYSVADSSFCSLQVTGDPNVPAGKLSFCVSAENVKLGSYNGFEREEVAPGEYENVYRDIGGWLSLAPHSSLPSFNPTDVWQHKWICAEPN